MRKRRAKTPFEITLWVTVALLVPLVILAIFRKQNRATEAATTNSLTHSSAPAPVGTNQLSPGRVPAVH